MRFSDLNFFFTFNWIIVVNVHCTADRAQWYNFCFYDLNALPRKLWKGLETSK